MLLRWFLRSKKKRWKNASSVDGVYFILADVEGCTAASGISNKYRYSVGCGKKYGEGGGVRPLFLLDLRSRNK